MEEFSDSIPLVIKHYNFKDTLSGIIHNSKRK